MLEISNEAIGQLAELLSQGGSDSAIRIAVMGGGNDSPGLGLIVDEAQDSDISIQKGAIPFIIDRSLIEYCQTITIRFTTGSGGTCGGSSGSGFLITPGKPINF
ncbi:MAG: hypothetical protein HKP41_00305 [Desulfobacterales bacterium]|nr:hypothetical protein [Desulfobacterales bacterium]